MTELKAVETKELRGAYKLTKENQEAICRVLADGNTVSAACGVARIDRHTFYDWLKRYPEFAEAVKNAKSDARSAVESTLHGLATNGNLLAIMYWLGNRYADDWKDTRNLKIDQTLALTEKDAGSKATDKLVEFLKEEGVDFNEFLSGETTEGED